MNSPVTVTMEYDGEFIQQLHQEASVQRQQVLKALSQDTCRNLPPEFSNNRQSVADELAEAYIDFVEAIGLSLYPMAEGA